MVVKQLLVWLCSIHNLLNRLVDIDPFLLATFIGVPPSFMVSGVYPSLYAAAQFVVDALPAVPTSAELELTLSLIDGFSRAYLLCDLVPLPVVTNTSTFISSSPWTLLITSLVSRLFSFIGPNAYQHRTIIARNQWRFLLNQSILILQPCRTLRADTSRAPGLRMDNHRFVVCSSCNWLVCLTYPFTTVLGRYAWPTGRFPQCNWPTCQAPRPWACKSGLQSNPVYVVRREDCEELWFMEKTLRETRLVLFRQCQMWNQYHIK